MDPAVPILAVVETVSSETDRNGNRYHFARFYSTQKGRQTSVCLEVGGDNNAPFLAYKLLGSNWEHVLHVQVTLPKTQWKHARPVSCLYEGGEQAKKALADLYAGAQVQS